MTGEGGGHCSWHGAQGLLWHLGWLSSGLMASSTKPSPSPWFPVLFWVSCLVALRAHSSLSARVTVQPQYPAVDRGSCSVEVTQLLPGATGRCLRAQGAARPFQLRSRSRGPCVVESLSLCGICGYAWDLSADVGVSFVYRNGLFGFGFGSPSGA